ncbi:hypothetical protein OROHE_019175 [Orobanche hederae]
MARYLRADSDNFLATNKNGDYTLTYDATQKFIGDGIIAKRCRFRYASYFKIDRGDKIHLVGIGVITEPMETIGWPRNVLGIENRRLIDKFGDNIALTRILVFEMSKDLLSRWNHLSPDQKNEAKAETIYLFHFHAINFFLSVFTYNHSFDCLQQAIIQDALHRLFKPRTSEDSDDEFEVMADDDIANLNTEPLEQVFENLLADMFDDEDKSNGTDIDVLGKALKIC